MKMEMLPLNNIFPSSHGFVARQTDNNNPYYRLLTWEFSRRCHSFITLPIPVLDADQSNQVWDVYLEGRKFIAEYQTRNLEPARILDLNILFSLCGVVLTRHRHLALQAGVMGPFFIKARLEDVWRTVPFIDLPAYLAQITKFDFPIVQDSDVMVPAGMNIESFLQIDPLQSSDAETMASEKRIKMDDSVLISANIFNALGITTDTLVTSSHEIDKLGNRRQQAQLKLNQS